MKSKECSTTPPHHQKWIRLSLVKPVVAKAEEVTEEPPKIVEIKEKRLVLETRRSRCSFVRSLVGPAQLKLLKKTIRFTTRAR
jgi:protein TonB